MSAVATLPRWAQSRWMPALVAAAAVVWIALTLVRLIWVWLAPVAGDAVSALPPVTPQRADDGISLAQYHLFGQAVDPATGAYANAPDTTLKLTLKGTSSHYDQQRARAVIADEQQVEKVYKVGDVFEGGVSVQAIYPDRVVLNAIGRIEVLRLRQLQAMSGATATAATPGAPRNVTAPGANGLIGLNSAPSAPGSVNPMVMAAPIDWEAVRQQAIADPGSIAKSFSVAPVMIGGKLAGVRVSSNVYGEQLAQAGLKVDDIVTAVNGRKLDSIEAGYTALESLRSAGAVTLTVNRDGNEQTLPAIRMPR